jgi:hypothetical protein
MDALTIGLLLSLGFLVVAILWRLLGGDPAKTAPDEGYRRYLPTTDDYLTRSRLAGSEHAAPPRENRRPGHWAGRAYRREWSTAQSNAVPSRSASQGHRRKLDEPPAAGTSMTARSRQGQTTDSGVAQTSASACGFRRSSQHFGECL